MKKIVFVLVVVNFVFNQEEINAKNESEKLELQEVPELVMEEFDSLQWEFEPFEEDFFLVEENYDFNDFNDNNNFNNFDNNNFDSNDYQNIVNYVKKQNEEFEKNIEIQAQNNNEYEDKVAKNWIFIFSFSLLVCIALFLYNIFKCYKKTIVQKPEDTRTYSKELQNANGTDDDDINININ
jgi:hypothetical protein